MASVLRTRIVEAAIIAVITGAITTFATNFVTTITNKADIEHMKEVNKQADVNLSKRIDDLYILVLDIKHSVFLPYTNRPADAKSGTAKMKGEDVRPAHNRP